MKRAALLLCAGILVCGPVAAEELEVIVHHIMKSGVGDEAGRVKAVDTEYGLVLTPNLQGLPPGLHGFHVHQKPDCGPGEKEDEMAAGVAAGGHYDPAGAGAHKGPYDEGHLGDLPALYVDASGKATHPMLAPRLKTSDLKGRSLMIHAGGDNYSDTPEELGGGGSRVACGEIE